MRAWEKSPADTPHDDALLSLPLASPWRRWCARLFDLWWECMLIGMVLGMVAGLFAPGLLDMIDSPGGDKLLGLAMLPPALLLDAALMAYFGNTPGKALLGLRVGLVDGRPVSFVQLCWRNLGVWAAGLGLGLPLVNLFTMARQHRRLVSGQAASYDEEGFGLSLARDRAHHRFVQVDVLDLDVGDLDAPGIGQQQEEERRRHRRESVAQHGRSPATRRLAARCFDSAAGRLVPLAQCRRVGNPLPTRSTSSGVASMHR